MAAELLAPLSFRHNFGRLKTAGGTFSGSLLISLVHKLTRRGYTSLLQQLVRDVVRACGALTRPQWKTVQAAFSHFLCRVVVAQFEEGLMLLSDPEQAKLFMQYMSAAQKLREEANCAEDAKLGELLERVGEEICKGLEELRHCRRGRLGSYVGHMIRSGTSCGKTAVDDVFLGKSKKSMRLFLTEWGPDSYKELMSLVPFKGCAELQKVVRHTAALRADVPPQSPAVFSEPPALNLDVVNDVGARDMHVVGRRSGEGRAMFVTRGLRVNEPMTGKMFSLNYQELETAYVDAFVARAKAELPPSEATKMMALLDPQAAPAPVPAPVPRDLDFIDRGAPMTGGLSFKNGVGLFESAMDAGPYPKGTRVCIKIGEDDATVGRAESISHDMQAIGLFTLKPWSVRVRVTPQFWTDLAREGKKKRKNSDWGTLVLKRLSAQDTFLMQVTPRFDGVKLTELGSLECAQDIFLWNLLMVLLFGKYKGVRDMGPFNLMVDAASGVVLLVDISSVLELGPRERRAYGAKNLLTVHPIHRRHRLPLADYVKAHAQEVRDFMRLLKQKLVSPYEEMPEMFAQEDTVAVENALRALR